jgi:hypothetical protein
MKGKSFRHLSENELSMARAKLMNDFCDRGQCMTCSSCKQTTVHYSYEDCLEYHIYDEEFRQALDRAQLAGSRYVCMDCGLVEHFYGLGSSNINQLREGADIAIQKTADTIETIDRGVQKVKGLFRK